jgi:hypothetical protein
LSVEDTEFLIGVFRDKTMIHKGDDRWVSLSSEYELHFAGDYGGLMRWLLECLKVNYENFLPGSLSASVAQGVATKIPSQSPNTSTGGSGDAPATSGLKAA